MENARPPKDGPGPGPPPDEGTKRRREGSRVLLAVSLAAAVAGAFLAGGAVADFVADSFGMAHAVPRLLLKIACVAAAVPACFYLVERAFLKSSSRP